MSRCVACNKPFTASEMVAKNPFTGDFEDMCSDCRGKARGYGNYTDDSMGDDKVISEVTGYDSDSGFY